VDTLRDSYCWVEEKWGTPDRHGGNTELADLVSGRNAHGPIRSVYV
jgi:hypothetical protein